MKIEVGYRGLFFGHSFRSSSWTPDKLVTWYLLIPFSKKNLKKVRKPGCPPPKNGGIQNGRCNVSKLTFSTFLALFWVFFLGKNMLFYVFDAKESISEGFINFWLFDFEKRAILFKIQERALFNDFSHIKTDLLLNRYQSKTKSHDWWAREISALFHRYLAHNVHFKSSFCLP